jgi:hypothetical protein
LSWREVKLAKGDLIVAVMYGDGWAKSAPPDIRALKEGAAKLEKSSVKVINWEPYDHRRDFEIIVRSILLTAPPRKNYGIDKRSGNSKDFGTERGKR